MRHLIRIGFLLVFAAGLIAGCNGDNGNDNDADDLPPVGSLLDESAGYIRDASSFELEIDVNGYPVELTVGALNLPVDVPLQFKYARGVFQAPDRIEANVQFSLGEISTTADLIAIDHDHYLRGDITSNRWIQEELIKGFTPQSLISDSGGIPDALVSIGSGQMVGRIDLDGLDVFHIHGTIEANAVNALTFGLIRTREGLLAIDVYVLVDDHRVAQIVLVEPPPAANSEDEPTTWLINLMEYDNDVSIAAPAMDDDAS